MENKIRLREYIERLASDDVVPGGGSAAALAATLGCSLIEMVTNLTIDRARYEDVHDEMKMIRNEIVTLRADLESLIFEDVEVYQKVMEAYDLPSNSEEEQKIRQETIQQKMYLAAIVPLNIARKALDALELVLAVMNKGNPNAVSDAKVGGLLLHSGITSSIVNVQANLKALRDPLLVNSLGAEIATIINKSEHILKDLTGRSI